MQTLWRVAILSASVTMLLPDAPAVSVLEGSKPNIIFILTDDQGMGDLSCMGNSILKTPHIDSLYEKSTRLADFHVSPTCAPTRAAIMSGRFPFEVGVSHTLMQRERLAPGVVTFPQALQKAGYRTGLFGKWHLGDEDAYLPQNRGFHEVLMHGAGGIGQYNFGDFKANETDKYFNNVLLHNETVVKTKGFCTDVFFKAAISWMKKQIQDNERFFAYISLNAPHGPLIAPETYKQRFLDEGYDQSTAARYGMIENIDDNVGLLMQQLREWRVLEDTLIIFMTDNGMAMKTIGQKGQSGRIMAHNAGLRGHKDTNWEGGTRVPSFWHWQGVLGDGVDVNALTAHIDLYRTFCGLAGVEVPESTIPPGGRSLLPLLEDPNAEWDDRSLFAHRGRWGGGGRGKKTRALAKYYGASVRTHRWRLVYEMDGEGPWLSDISNDPGETKNLIEVHPEIAQSMKADFDQWWDSTEPLLVNEGLPRLRPGEYPLHQRYEKQVKEQGIPDWEPETMEQMDWPGKASTWNGYQRFAFEVDGRKAFVVIPKQAAAGRPWVWRARFPKYHPEVDVLLLERGFHVAYINTDDMLGSPKALEHWDAFYSFMSREKGLAQKVALEAVSRGGLFAYRWAARNPEAVACIYADVPVCDFKSWPLGQADGLGNAKAWQNLLKQYELTEEEALAYRENPVDVLAPIAEAEIPLLHLVSLNDRVVPPVENTFVLAERYRELGGQIEIIEVREASRSNGHHFDHPDPKRAADFIARNTKRSFGESEPVAKEATGSTQLRGRQQDPSQPVNIIYIMLDEWGYFEWSAMGHPILETPNIDRLAAEGMRFTQFLAGANVCAPTRSVLMTGQHTGHTTVRGNSGGAALCADDPTIADMLKEAGYATGGFGKWGLGDAGTTGVPEKHGFDVFFGYYHQGHAHTYYPRYLVRNSVKIPLQGNTGDFLTGQTFSHELIFQESIQFIRENAGQPFFAYLPWTPPHGLWAMPEDEPAWQKYKDQSWGGKNQRGKQDAEMYAAMIEMVDRQIGEIVALLKELDIDNQTVIFLCGDNGGQPYFKNEKHPHGVLAPNLNPKTGKRFRGGKGNFYEGGLRIPFIVHWPGKIKAGSVSDHLGYFPDVMPTLAELTGATPREDHDGISILPTLLGETEAGRKQEQHSCLYWEGKGSVALRMNNWKAIQPGKDKPFELYDLEQDLEELQNVAGQFPEILSKMKEFAQQAHTPPRMGKVLDPSAGFRGHKL